MVDENILSKIRKLLKLAADTSTTPDEAALAAARVQELLYKYNLSLADVSAEDIVEVNRLGITEAWRVVLGAVVSRHNFCQMLAFNNGLRFIGKPHDVQAVLYLFTYLSRAIQKGSHDAWTAHWTALTDPILGTHPSLKERGRREEWINSYRIGAVQTIALRLEKQAKERERVQHVEGLLSEKKDALVRTSNALTAWNEKLHQHVQDKYKPRPVEFDETVVGGAFAQGALAGLRLGLRKGLGIGTSRKGLT